MNLAMSRGRATTNQTFFTGEGRTSVTESKEKPDPSRVKGLLVEKNLRGHITVGSAVGVINCNVPEPHSCKMVRGYPSPQNQVFLN